MALISVIIINYNTSKLTIDSIKSIGQYVSDLENIEVIIIDNASKIEDYKNLEEALSKINVNIKLQRSRINVGFGAGNMMGIQQASGKYYVFMNSDVLLTQDSITVMIHFLEQNKNACMVGCQAVDENGKKYKAFDYALSLSSELIGHSLLHSLFPKKFPKRMINSGKPMKVGAVPGSLFMSVAEDFNSVGGFDSNIFLYFEEKDLAFRMQKQLKKDIYTLPGTTYIHLKGKSTGTSQIIRNEMKISQFYVIRKNLGSLKYYIFYFINLLIFTIKAPFNSKNRKYLWLLLGGISVAKSMKHFQKIN